MPGKTSKTANVKTVFHLLNASASDLQKWVTSQDPEALRLALRTIDSEIRNANLTGGQPRGMSSAGSVDLARFGLRIAEATADDRLLAEAWRMLAYSLNADEQFQEALAFYEKAIPALEKLGDFPLAARTRLGYLGALKEVGKYAEALQVAGAAEQWFSEHHDDLSLAKLWNNLAHLYNRLDRPLESHRYLQMAAAIFDQIGDQKAQAQVSLNLAVTLAWLDRFEESDRMYERTETLSLQLGMTEVWAQASYNRAYLHYLRGRYSDALPDFSKLRVLFERSGSRIHYALCDLDESEIYLQLNLSKDAAALALRAAEQFKALERTYEHAKANSFLGVALMQQGRFSDALQIFESAQKEFESEGNIYRVAVLDLYRAEVHYSLRRFWEARSLAAHAKMRFSELGIPSKKILSLVVLGRAALELKDLAAAQHSASEIEEITRQTDVPLLLFPYYLLRGDIANAKQAWSQAEAFYIKAAGDLEAHQARLHQDDLRVTFFKGRNRAYEELVWLKLQHPGDLAIGDAYSWCERSKSRGLIELLAQHLPTVQPVTDQPLLGKIRRLREELNVLYVRTQPERGPAMSVATETIITNKEEELARTLREASVADPEYASLQQVTTASLESIHNLLSPDQTLIEYFFARGEVLAFVVTRGNAFVERQLCPVSRVNDIYQRLTFQLEKFLLGPEFVAEHGEQIFAATRWYLGEFHQALIAPFAGKLETSQLTIVSHGLLHLLPFHAFFDGSHYLMDRFDVSYAPSASVLKYCMEKPDIEGAPPLLIAVPDEQAPHVEAEVRAIAEMLPDATVLVGPDATRQAFAKLASRASLVHIATHAVFRQDNPMFSGFKLHDGWVTAYDLFSMTCQTNLVTLSSCKSGMNQIAGSDDLLGLSRGFLYAGARALMVSLWNIDDETTSQLMTRFYDGWRRGLSRAQALALAMKSIRGERSNPFYWAPFSLIGKG
jgi:CHAT domain-containing protein/tetratricopeptide (TPR) repeat protein